MNTNTLERTEPAIAGSIRLTAAVAGQKLAVSDLEQARFIWSRPAATPLGIVRHAMEVQAGP